jgi:hypothetical protein
VADALRRFARWLFGVEPRPVQLICLFCAREKCVHDVTTGMCITTWCRCGGREARRG